MQIGSVSGSVSVTAFILIFVVAAILAVGAAANGAADAAVDASTQAGAAASTDVAAPTDSAAPVQRVMYMDSVVFGDPVSESAHNLTESNSVIVEGGLGQVSRRLGSSGSLAFELKCDPVKQNYVTVRLWGSDSGEGMLLFGRPIISSYGSAWPELDQMKADSGYQRKDAEQAFPGRFYYSTYAIPLYMTRNQTKVRLTILSTGASQPYASNPADKVAVQKSLSRGVYEAYSHTDPFFVPDASVPQGETPELGPTISKPSWSEEDLLKRELNQAVRTVMTWQYFGPDWDEQVAEGRAPAMMTGAVGFGGKKGSSSWTKQQWKDNLYVSTVSTGNSVIMNALWLYAEAYVADWSDFRGKEEMIDRVIAGLDYFVLAQGRNGGFHDADRAKRWIGAPIRTDASGCIEGVGDTALGEAFTILASEFEARGLLDQLIDDDDNPNTPMVTRRQAYTNMFKANRDYLVSDLGRGHAPNQDLIEIVAMWNVNQALSILSPDDAWSRDKALEYAYSAAGITKDVYGGYWISPKGLVMEPNGSAGGGYSGDYGVNTVSCLVTLAKITGDEQIAKKASDAVTALANYYYLTNDVRGRVQLVNENVVTWRNNGNPGRVNYGGDVALGLNSYAALELGVPAAIRQAQLLLDHGRIFQISLSWVHAHYLEYIRSAADLYENLGRLKQLPPTDYRLPMEPGGSDFAWADEMAGAVVIRQGDARIYMSLNWRHSPGSPRSPENASANKIARIHYTTPAIDRIANVFMDVPDGFNGLWTLQYGDYLIQMNHSEDKTYDVTVPGESGSVIDLISRRSFASGSVVELAPMSTLIFYTGK